MSNPNQTNGNGNGNGENKATPGYTGRYIVSFEPTANALSLLDDQMGLKAASAQDIDASDVQHGNVFFESIATAVVDAPPDAVQQLRAAEHDSSSPILHVEPERINWAINLDLPVDAPAEPPPLSLDEDSLLNPDETALPELQGQVSLNADFLRGYAAAANGLLSVVSPAVSYQPELARTPEASAANTWGLIATRVVESRYSGQGIRVAVLDTGFDFLHPDFQGRTVRSQSFIPGQAAQDGHGHGTHCIGTACGPRTPGIGPRYGVAYAAQIYVGKVLSNQGSGADGGILAGIDWAVRSGCAVISMSLGAATAPGSGYSQVYENAARRAAARGSLIIAAAGNDSRRPGVIRPVSHPANCPAIVAVGAVDTRLSIASFSNGGVNPNGGEVNIVGPGVSVTSSWLMPTRYRTIQGTSMATPHVAGIAALYAQATGLRGFALANAVLRASRRFSPARDFGWGLVQAR